jgi:hypothetical protein
MGAGPNRGPITYREVPRVLQVQVDVSGQAFVDLAREAAAAYARQ